jgi:hypothetical protein
MATIDELVTKLPLDQIAAREVTPCRGGRG